MDGTDWRSDDGPDDLSAVIGMGRLWDAIPTLLLTNSTGLAVPDDANVTFRSTPTAAAMSEWSAQTPNLFWVFGGSNVVTAALLGWVVDTLDITIMPEAFGDWIPLFSEPYLGPMRIIKAVPYDNDVTRLLHDTNREQAS